MTGVLAVNRRGLDLFGAVVLGTVTSLGGGTIRDLVLGVPVFWLGDVNYLSVALSAAAIGFVASRTFLTTYTLLLYLDGLGAALFAVVATEKVLALGHQALVAVVMGVLTGIGGGLVRDVLAGRPTLLMSREIYATPILVGSVVYVSLQAAAIEHAAVYAAAAAFALRAAVIHWHLEMPRWLTSG